jgi:hypothetical protein
MSAQSQKMYCPECLDIIKKNQKSRMNEIKNEGGLYHYSGSMNRHRRINHGVDLTKGGKN